MDRLIVEYRDLIIAEEMILRQKLKHDWFSCMDRGTPYFYSIFKSKSRKARIISIQLEDGHMVSDDKAIGKEFTNYFGGLLGVDYPMQEAIDDLVIRSGTVLSIQQQQRLINKFNAADIRHALGAIQEEKTPGMDGYTSLFFKRPWGIIGEDVTEAILGFFYNGCLLKEINTTILHLIPKHDHALRPSEFRPITCCSTLYKIIAKMLFNRLAEVLPTLVDVSQSAFVCGRSIIDNVLLCQELMIGYDRKFISPRCMAKIDLCKAYDSVNWSFVQQLMMKIGFPAAFVNWIMRGIPLSSLEADWTTSLNALA
ncbi:hypothetical protein Dimus_039359 [Dionaea muscipula]